MKNQEELVPEEGSRDDLQNKLLALSKSTVLPRNIANNVSNLANDPFLEQQVNKQLASETLNSILLLKNPLVFQHTNLENEYHISDLRQLGQEIDQQICQQYDTLTEQIKSLGEVDALEMIVNTYGS